MLRNNFQSGFLSLLYTSGTHPLQMWEAKGTVGIQISHDWQHKPGGVSLIRDEDIQAKVVEVVGENISDNYIYSPPSKTLGIKLPFFILNVKNVSIFYSFISLTSSSYIVIFPLKSRYWTTKNIDEGSAHPTIK